MRSGSQSCGLRPGSHGLSHALIDCPPDSQLPRLRRGRAFKSYAAYQKSPTPNGVGLFWQGHKDLNPEPTVLETAALPIELYPYMFNYVKGFRLKTLVGLQGFEPGTIRL